MEACFFSPCVTGNVGKPIITVGPDRVRSIIRSSKARQDVIHEDLEQRLEADESMQLKCHKDCVSTYTSRSHIDRHLKRMSDVESSGDVSTKKRSRRSDTTVFDFNEHCIFCGETRIPFDKKNPNRWRRVICCRTADRGNQRTFKKAILDVCESRQDEVGHQVKIRVMGAVSDLHAADARYHDDCRKSFMAPRSVAAATHNDKGIPDIEPAITSTASTMKDDMLHIWNSKEVYNIYKDHGGKLYSRRTLLCKLVDMMGSDLLVLSGVGVCSILLFRSRSASLINLVASEEDDSTEVDIRRIATKVTEESKQLARDTKSYQTRVSINKAYEAVSPTLQCLLSRISEKLHCTLPGALIGNIITNTITNRPTTLQIALGILVNRKSLIENLHDYRVTCSYDEVQRFKASAAKASALDSRLRGTLNTGNGLVQVVADNFDTNISSQNGLVSTHSLAVLLTMKDDESAIPQDEHSIKRLSREEMKMPISEDVPVQRYTGPKKPGMPVKESKRAVLPLRILAHQAVQLARTQALDFEFLKHVTSDDKTPEFAGFNTKLCREQGQAVQPATRAVYTPLIDMDPADHDTMLTAMEEGKRLTSGCGQIVTVFTNDQQLYRVAVDVTWVYPEKFSQFIPRLGGMHTLMSFIGSVGNLMADSGLEEVMKSAFGGVAHMLSGKKFPQNFRALRLVTEEVLRSTLAQADTHEELMNTLMMNAEKSATTKLWVQNLVKPVLLMMAFVRAEREGDWPLHLWSFKEMLPYFFAAGHHNYARYGLYYLRSMERLDGDILRMFMKGEHVMRHRRGLWNGIWSDMYIETTFMRYGHGPNGIVGITLQPSTLKEWAYSMHVCSQIVQDLSDMSEGQMVNEVTTHKEENSSRIRSDASDRNKIQQKLLDCIDPLDPTDHEAGVINIVTGRIGPEKVNAHEAVEIGRTQMIAYEESWPAGFNSTLSKVVTTMAVTRKALRVGPSQVCDLNLIYSRVIGLQQTRSIKLSDVLEYELAPVPTSLFDEKGQMRTATKSTLKKGLQVSMSSRVESPPDVTIIDGCAILWIIHWPNRGSVEDFVENFKAYIFAKVEISDVYLVFDRYHDFSIKSGTRLARAGQHGSRRHRLSLQTPLPPQKVVLTVTENKVQLIDIICQHLIKKCFLKVAAHNRLVITGQDATPIEIHNGSQRCRNDLRTTQEEADVIMIQQVAAAAKSGADVIKVISDDTDVFVLLVYHFAQLDLNCQIIMEATSSGRCSIDIGATAAKHKSIVKQLPAMHALTGCDTVAQLYGRGKLTALKTLTAGSELNKMGDVDASIDLVTAEATAFVAASYGSKKRSCMSDVRKDIWATKMAKPKVTKAPDIKVLPPTTESFQQHVRRAHIQTAIWKSAAGPTPPPLDPTDYGWSREDSSKSLVPIMLPPDVALAPPEILEVIRCGCSSAKPCSTALCRCAAAKLTCTIFCSCHGESSCRNEQTKATAICDLDSDTE